MKSLEQCFADVENAFDELVANAIELRDLSKGMASAGELRKLQNKQEQYLKKLTDAERRLQELYRLEITSAMHEQLALRLQQFQAINQEFIANLRTGHALIQFDNRENREAGELNNRQIHSVRDSPEQKI